MKHLGDITKINGAEIEPVHCIIGGSPCQDLSIAGKRAGLNGERSGLFMEQVRIVKEMREKYGTAYPRFMVWENVPRSIQQQQRSRLRGGFSGKKAQIAAVDEACLVACTALDKQIPKKPYNRVKLGEKTVIGTCPTCGDGGNSEYPYCGRCGQALDWSDEV